LSESTTWVDLEQFVNQRKIFTPIQFSKNKELK